MVSLIYGVDVFLHSHPRDPVYVSPPVALEYECEV